MALPPLELFSLKKKPPCCRVAFSCLPLRTTRSFPVRFSGLRHNPSSASTVVLRTPHEQPVLAGFMQGSLSADRARNAFLVRFCALLWALLASSARERISVNRGQRAIGLRGVPQLYRSGQPTLQSNQQISCSIRRAVEVNAAFRQTRAVGDRSSSAGWNASQLCAELRQGVTMGSLFQECRRSSVGRAADS